MRKLTLITPSGENCIYAFVQFNDDTQYALLPKEGHLSAMIDGVPSRNACRCLCHLEVHQLLQWKDWVVYPEGLNRDLEPVTIPLPVLVACGITTSVDLTQEPTFIQVITRNHVGGASAPGRTPMSVSPSHLHLEGHAKVDSHTSMTAEVRKLLSHAALDTSSQGSGVSTPTRLVSMASRAPSSQGEDSSKPIATSSQASPQAVMPDNNEPLDQTPKGAHTPTKDLGAGTSILPKEVISLQEEMNRAMEHLLMARSSLDAH